MNGRYQILIDRDGRLEDDGCWGGEHAFFEDQEAAQNAARGLVMEYPECAFVVVDNADENLELFRIYGKHYGEDAARAEDDRHVCEATACFSDATTTVSRPDGAELHLCAQCAREARSGAEV